MNNVLEFPRTNNQELARAAELFAEETADLAVTEFTRLLDNGCDEAFVFLGAIHEFGGYGVKPDFLKAIFYYENAIERMGAVEAYLGLIRIYFYGKDGQRNCGLAMDYCDVLIEDADFPIARIYKGLMLMEGCGFSRDIHEARAHFEMAQSKGHVFGLTYLGTLDIQQGRPIRGWLKRLKAGFTAFRIGWSSPNDWRIRAP